MSAIVMLGAGAAALYFLSKSKGGGQAALRRDLEEDKAIQQQATVLLLTETDPTKLGAAGGYYHMKGLHALSAALIAQAKAFKEIENERPPQKAVYHQVIRGTAGDPALYKTYLADAKKKGYTEAAKLIAAKSR